MRQLWEYLPIVTLYRYSPRFSDDKSPRGGNPGDPRGIEMESGRMTNEASIGQFWKWEKACQRVLLMKGGFQSVVYLQDTVKLAWNKTQNRYTSLISKGNKKGTLMSQNCSRTKIYIYIYIYIINVKY
jgi:hypothetical protein